MLSGPLLTSFVTRFPTGRRPAQRVGIPDLKHLPIFLPLVNQVLFLENQSVYRQSIKRSPTSLSKGINIWSLLSLCQAPGNPHWAELLTLQTQRVCRPESVGPEAPGSYLDHFLPFHFVANNHREAAQRHKLAQHFEVCSACDSSALSEELWLTATK